MKNIGDMMGLMKQAQKMKKEMSRIKKEISKSIIIASDSNQIITISVNGDYQVKKVTVNDDALKNMSTKQIENVVEEAFSNTIKQVKDMTNKNNDKIFIFNGWTFSSDPNLTPFDHAIYDLQLVNCNNV